MTLRYALLLTLLLAGCADTPEEQAARQERREERARRGTFGDPYEIVLSENAAEPDRPPGLDGDTLDVQVAYSGGCTDHTFDLDHRVRRDTAFLWLYHDAFDDTCEAYLYDELRLGLPARALDAGAVVLRNPAGGPPFVLRRP